MAIKPISCGISNINLQTMGKTGEPELGQDMGAYGSRWGMLFASICESVSKEGPSSGFQGILSPFPASGVRMMEKGCRKHHLIRKKKWTGGVGHEYLPKLSFSLPKTLLGYISSEYPIKFLLPPLRWCPLPRVTTSNS